MQLELRNAAFGQLRGAIATLEPGLYALLSNEAAALADLIALVCGRVRPRTGQVLLGGSAPFGDARSRRRLAALFADEVLPPATSVRDAVAKALAARGAAPEEAERLLERAGLFALIAQSPAMLDQRELRSVALALALAHDGAELLALYEPLATLLAPSFVHAEMMRHLTRGALVLYATTSPADASTLGGHLFTVELGRLQPDAITPRLGVGPWQRVLVEASDARALARLLHDADSTLSTELGRAEGVLVVTGPALDVTVAAVIAAARKSNIELVRIEPAVPPVEALMAARAGFARGAYEAARMAAAGSPAR